MWFWRRSKHQVSERELSAYVDGQLSPNVRARLEEHLPSCAACRDSLGELHTLRSALGSLPRVAAPRSFALREADVEPAAVAQPLNLLGRATPMLGGLTAAAVITFGVLLGVDVSDRGTDRAAGNTANARSVPDVADEDVSVGQSAAEIATAPTGLNPSAFPPDQQKQLNPFTAPSVGTPLLDGPDGAAGSTADSNKGGLPSTPCLPGALCDEFSETTGPPETNNVSGLGEDGKFGTAGSEREPALTPCPPTMLCVQTETDQVPLTGGLESPAVAPVGEEDAATNADQDSEANAELRSGDGQFELRGDADGVAAAPSVQADDDGYTALRAAETAMAALAIVGAASLVLVWWRRRAGERR